MRACEYSALLMIKFLVANGADINAKCDSGWTALYSCIRKQSEDTFNYLIDAGVDIEGKRGQIQGTHPPQLQTA